MSDMKDPLYIAEECLKLNIADPDTKKLFSTFNSIFSLRHRHLRSEPWLQKRFPVHNSSFILTILSDTMDKNTNLHSLICQLQWQHDGDSWSKHNELSKSLFERLENWVETYNPESAQVKVIMAPIPATNKRNFRTIEIIYSGAVHNDTIRGKSQDFIENICNYMKSFSIVEEEE